jgi:hypothetical protein
MIRPCDKMEWMLRFAALTLLATALHAQTAPPAAEKPPAKVDAELRTRVNQFYQDFVKGQFTDAETLVAPESKNVFVAMRKEQYVSCEIKKVVYSDKFKFADVGTECARNIMVEGFAGHPLQYPIGSQWKLEHGKWYWWIDPTAQRSTPFGMMGALMAAMGAASPAGPPPALPAPADLTSPNIALHKVKADKESLDLKAGESADVTFSNSALGPMSVALYGAAPQGIEVTPTHADLPQTGKAAITVKVHDGAPSATLVFQVMPTQEAISVKVAVR